jgi:hypothetical protein
MTCLHTATLGVYLLGALEPEDRSTFESHLSGCDVCRRELIRLAPLPGLLNQITPADFEDLSAAPPPVPEPVFPAAELLPETDLDRAVPAAAIEPTPVRPRRKRYWALATAAAVAVVLAVGAVLGVQAMNRPAEPAAVVWQATDPTTGVSAKVQLVDRGWGTELTFWMDNVPPDRQCGVKVKARMGYEGHNDLKNPFMEFAGWWGTDHYDPHEAIPGSTSIDVANIYQLDFVDRDMNTLVSIHAPKTG